MGPNEARVYQRGIWPDRERAPPPGPTVTVGDGPNFGFTRPPLQPNGMFVGRVDPLTEGSPRRRWSASHPRGALG